MPPASGGAAPIITARRSPRMKCGWGCGEQLTGRNMRAHFTICAERPGGLRRRGPERKARRGRPGPRMPCGWRCGSRLTASGMRSHYTGRRGRSADWRCGIRGCVVGGCSCQTRHLPQRDLGPASPKSELCTSGAYSARSERIGKHFATDRYLSRGGTVDAAVPPGLACTTSGIALTPVAERDGCSGARLALGRYLRNGEKAAVARCWDGCHFSAPHRGGPERAAPNILNNEKVFTVF
jgi:hypothetical protein